jgi:hypothetical protein
MSDLSDYAAIVISHNRNRRQARLAVVRGACCNSQQSSRGLREATKQVEITLADPVFDPQRQISRKFFWCPERLISAIGMEVRAHKDCARRS